MMQRQRGLAYGGSIGAVFPALNEQGAIHYVQTRYLNPGTGPKYDNPAASLGGNPRLAWTQLASAAQSALLVICEGIPDSLTAAALGHRSVAILGSQAPNQPLALDISNHATAHGLALLMVNDHDDAGRAWAALLVDLFSKSGSVIQAAEPDEPGSDFNDWCLTRSVASGRGLTPWFSPSRTPEPPDPIIGF